MFIVTEQAMRPASKLRQCFYCAQAVGAVHKSECVLINRKVKVRMTVEYEIEVPALWSKELIEFQRNDGSWCADNALGELEEIVEAEGCLCSVAHFDYLGEVDGKYYLVEQGK